MADLRTWDATETVTRLAARDVSPAEVVEAAIERAEASQVALQALVTPTFDAARRQAATRSTGPFAGVPTAIKDLSDVEGVETAHGSRAWKGHIASRTSEATRQFLGLGYVSIGKSATSEFGLVPSCEAVGFQPTQNPWASGYSPGGSSGGAAALVAAGVVPVGHAADGGGSIRIPASACGLVGLKPSHRRLTLVDDMDRIPIPISTYGVVTRSVRDTAAFHAAAECQDPVRGLPRIGAVTGPSSRRLRIAVVVDTPLGIPLHPDVREAVDQTASLCSGLGHNVEYVTAPFGQEFADDFTLYWGLLAQGILLTSRQTLGKSFDVEKFDPWTRALASHARRNPHRIPGAVLRLRRFREEHETIMAPWDVMLTSTMGTPAPPIGHLSPTADWDTLMERIHEFLPYTPAQNVSGLPAMSLPLATSKSGLPIGLQFGAGFGEERTLLELAYELEAANPWQKLAPAP